MPRHDGLADFRLAAAQRLKDAEELLEPPTLEPNGPLATRRHLRGAMYLAGYAVECITKAYLISMHAPLNTLSDVDAKLRRTTPEMPNLLSASGHSIEVVVRFTDLAAEQNEHQRRSLGFVASEWSTDLRYNG